MKFIRALDGSSNVVYFNVDRVHAFYTVDAGGSNWAVNVTLVDSSGANLLDGFASENDALAVMNEIVNSIGSVNPLDFQ
jgi:hypothetical protein